MLAMSLRTAPVQTPYAGGPSCNSNFLTLGKHSDLYSLSVSFILLRGAVISDRRGLQLSPTRSPQDRPAGFPLLCRQARRATPGGGETVRVANDPFSKQKFRYLC